MINKRGQVTIFVIIAILLISSVALYFLFGSSLGFGQRNLDPDIEKVYLFAEDCMKGNLEESLYWVGQGGGYYLPRESFTNSNGIPYYIYNGDFYYPTEETINNEISSYINSNIDYCLNEFKNFSEFNISKGDISSITEIKNEEVVSEVNYPITIQRVDEKTIIKDFEVKTYSRIKEMYEFAGEILQTYSNDGLCLSCIYETAAVKDFKIDITNDEEGIIITIIDETPQRNHYEFKFAIYNE